MSSETLRSSILDLMKSSRKAVRLYNGVVRASSRSEVAELNARNWLEVNEDLVNELALVLDNGHKIPLGRLLGGLLKRYMEEASSLSLSLSLLRERLKSMLEMGNFNECYNISKKMVAKNARKMALEAVITEISKILKRHSPSVMNSLINIDSLANTDTSADGFSKKVVMERDNVVHLSDLQTVEARRRV